jgi:hypothetical protein
MLLVNSFRRDSPRVEILRRAVPDVTPNRDECATSQAIKRSLNHNYGSPLTKQTVPYWTVRTGDPCAFFLSLPAISFSLSAIFNSSVAQSGNFRGRIGAWIGRTRHPCNFFTQCHLGAGVSGHRSTMEIIAVDRLTIAHANCSVLYSFAANRFGTVRLIVERLSGWFVGLNTEFALSVAAKERQGREEARWQPFPDWQD